MRRFVDNFHQFIATIERLTTDTCHACANCQFRQICTIIECFITDIRNTVTNHHTCQVIAILESIFIDIGDIGRQHQIRFRSRISNQNLFYAVRIHDITVIVGNRACHRVTAVIHCYGVISNVTVRNTAFCHRNMRRFVDSFHQFIATIERLVTDTCHTCTDSHARQIFAIIECIITNLGYAVTNHYTCQFVAIS